MENLFSVRMRASQKTRGKKGVICSETHISGAEGLYTKPELQRIVSQYIGRAMAHPRGKADHIVVTLEEIKQKPARIHALPVTTVQCKSPFRGTNIVKRILYSLGISPLAADSALALFAKGNMRGAALVTSEKGIRLEPDRKRGVRVSRLGIDKSAQTSLAIRLARQGINTDTVKEALILASKIASVRDIIAELCISDDPDYTTGYVASGTYGYLRVPHIKPRGSKMGGRAFFVKDGTRTEAIIHYLERVPVVVHTVSRCRGSRTIDEIIGHTHQ